MKFRRNYLQHFAFTQLLRYVCHRSTHSAIVADIFWNLNSPHHIFSSTPIPSMLILPWSPSAKLNPSVRSCPVIHQTTDAKCYFARVSHSANSVGLALELSQIGLTLAVYFSSTMNSDLFGAFALIHLAIRMQGQYAGQQTFIYFACGK